MAGRGPAPRRPDLVANGRRMRGDWIVLEPLTAPVLPALPRRATKTGTWSARTRAAWDGMRDDPATGLFGKPEIALAIELAYLIEQSVREPKTALLTEIRLRQDALGLTPKGKRDLRLVLESNEPAPPRLPGPRRLSARGRFPMVPAVDPSLVDRP